MPNDVDLLRRFQPQLRYDSNEAFFADSAAEWTDNPGNVLCRFDLQGQPGEVIAAATPGPGQPRLSLEFLGHPAYGNAAPYEDRDAISNPKRNYRDQYVALRLQPGLRESNVRASTAGLGRSPLAAVLVLLLLQRLQPCRWDRAARRRLGDDPAAHARQRARRRPLRAASLGRTQDVGSGREGARQSRHAARLCRAWLPCVLFEPGYHEPRPGTTSRTASDGRPSSRSR